MLNIGEILQNYRIVRLLSRRETGNLYQAVDMQSGRPVGIQVFPWSFSGDERSIARMWREVAPLYKLEHPNICRILRVANFQGRVFLVTDLLDGSPLGYVVGGMPLASDLVVSYGFQIASALQAAHGIGILHLGLNLESVFVTSLGLKLFDFGLATPIHTVFPDKAEELRFTFAKSSTIGTGLIFCTYMSPEQAAGMAVDARSDLFSLGAVLYEMATGVPAFGSSRANQTAERLLQNLPASPRTVNPDISAALEGIILKAIAKEREQRYQTSAQMIHDLTEIMDVHPLIVLQEFTTAEHLLLDQLASDPQNSKLEGILREVEEQIRRIRKSGYIRQLCWQAEEAANSNRYAEAVEIYTRAANVDPSADEPRSKKDRSPENEERARTIRDIRARIDHLRKTANIEKVPDWIESGSAEQQDLKNCILKKSDILSRYRIERILQNGADGVLCEARHEMTGERVAVKILQMIAGKQTEMTIREDPGLLSRLDHPNLCVVHEVGEYNGFPYVVEDYLEGSYSLERVMDLGEMPPVRRLEVVRQVCLGLDYAHRNGLTGLDIDPSMVMLKLDGQVKLIDYWITRPQIVSGLTAGQKLRSKDKYRPPEEWKGTRSLANVNVWALGVMLYRLFTYRHPFSGFDANELAANIENQRLRALASQLTNCPPGLDQVLANSLANDPQHRYQSAAAMAADLQSIIASLGPDRLGEQPARPSDSSPSSGPSRAQDSSSPGASDSASSGGSFTQFFSTGRPAPPAQSLVPPPAPAHPAPPPPADKSWKDDPFFRPVEKPSPPEDPSQSVTSILSSLGSSGPGSSAPRQTEPAPHRPEPLPSYMADRQRQADERRKFVDEQLAAARSLLPAGRNQELKEKLEQPKHAEEPGGVTRLIQRLAQEPPGPVAPPPAAPPAPPASSGPGEFTRMIAGLGGGPAAEAPAAPPAPAPPPAPPAPAFAMPTAPSAPPTPGVAPPRFRAPGAAGPPPPAFATAAPAVPTQAFPKPPGPPADVRSTSQAPTKRAQGQPESRKRSLRRSEPSELLDRTLDLALAPSVPVLTPVEIRALVRLPSSKSLSELLNREQEPELANSVRSRSFGLEFLRDSTGRLKPVDITMRIVAPDFEPPLIEKKVRVRPDRDCECQTFLLTPKQAGVLRIQFEVLADDITVASQVLKMQSETSDRLHAPTDPVLVSVPLSIVVRPRRRWIWAAAAVMILAICTYFGVLASWTNHPGLAATRGFKPQPAQPSDAGLLSGKNYALLFATDDYQYWPHLNNPLSDARTIAEELRDNYGYTDIPPRVITNPTTKQIVDTLHEYAAKVYGPSDQLFIYFAGHGFFDEEEKQGFLVGADSRFQRDDTAHYSYLDFSRLSTMLDSIPIQHIFVVLDVCYGGAFDSRVTKWAGPRGDEYADVSPDKFIRRKLAVKGRLYLTSGEITSVPDGRPGQHSPFARRFIASLRNYGGKKQLVTATSIAVDVGKIEPEPRFGEFGDSAPGADFLFIPK